MGELARVYPRYGYRRIQVFLGRDGHAMSAGRASGSGAQRACRFRASGRAGG
jgi:hypothetical protein